MKRLMFVIAMIFVVLVLTAFMNFNWVRNIMSDDVKLIPRSTLFSLPDRSMVRMSPDGKFVSYLGLFDGVQNIITSPAIDCSTMRRLTFDAKRNINSYQWTFTPNLIVYSQDTDGDENDVLFLLDTNTLKVEQITPNSAKAYIGMVSADKPSEIIYLVNDRNPSYFDVYLYDLNARSKKLLFKNDEYQSFDFDGNLNIRFATKVAQNGDHEIYQFPEGGASKAPQLFQTVPFEDTDYTGIIGLNQDGDKLYMITSVGRDFAGLYEYSLASGQSKLLGESDKADIDSVLLHPRTLEVEGFSYVYDRTNNVLFAHDMQQEYERLRAECDGDITIASRSHNDVWWIVMYEQDKGPVKYYLYNRKNKKLKYLFVHNREVADVELNAMHPVNIEARDGLKMMSYLSVPEHMWDDVARFKVKQPMPLILYVHGGPNARDFWGYNAVHQWLTNRGYAVLSVNYRGSRGFGKKFIRAGDGQWAAKMQDDLLDAVDWAIKQGITTKDQVAIYGGSYGGYAALVGLTMTPDVFACGVDVVGPSNLKTLYDSIPPYWEPYRLSLQRKFGFDPDNPESEELLKQKSPFYHIHNVRKPILIAQGANDPRVKQAESDQIVEKLHAADIPYTYLLYFDEGHGFRKKYNRMSFFGFTEKFFAECFGKERYEPLDNLELTSSKMKLRTNKIQLFEASEERAEENNK